MTEPSLNLKQKTLKGLAWTGGAQGGKQISQFMIIAILANLLSPDDFGLLGMATFFTGLISIFNEMGFSNALIQKKNITDRHYSSVFWLSIIIGIFLFLLMIPLSFPIAGFYKEPRLRPILILLSLNFIIFSFGLVQKAILQKEMEFKKIAVIDLTAILSGGVVGVFLALSGHGVYSLVYQLIVFTSMDMVLLWFFSKWRPRLEFSLSAIKDIWGFSLNLTGFNIINYFARNLDYLLVGKFLGAQALGFYTLAYRLMTYPLQNISWTIMKVMFPALSKIQDDLERVRFAYKKMIKAISLATFPMMLGLFALAPEFIHLVFGPKWAPVVPLVRIFCICGLIQSIGTTVGTIVLSQGKAKLHFQLGVLFTIFITIAILLGLHWGIVGVALFYSVFSIIWIHGVNFGVSSWLIKLKYSQFYAQLVNSYLMSILMMLIIFLAKQSIPSYQPLGLVSLIGIGAMTYLGLLFLTGELGIRNKTLFLKVLD